jgi:ABC-type sugar transport system ATPase subunit
MSLLRVKNMTKRYGGVTALDDVSFELEEGIIKGLIGPNGAGKSTLFNCMSGFEAADGGIVTIGRNEQELPAGKRAPALAAGITRTFQTPALFDDLTVRENLLVPLTASSERLAAPAQYQIRRAFVRITSFPFRDFSVPANTPALYVRTMQYLPVMCPPVSSFLPAVPLPCISVCRRVRKTVSLTLKNVKIIFKPKAYFRGGKTHGGEIEFAEFLRITADSSP